MKSTATRKIKWNALENVRLAYSAQLKKRQKSRCFEATVPHVPMYFGPQLRHSI